ncbi:histone deacetylase family protein [Arenibaculum sp.]|jgi:acetoin utilization deacetylase AcuC-like enzyme|uniref:histone deacetylase family protein n=1 Tax=Arenibaculum sp. TaxID=2865862 RepID=UPI002E0F7569|nr:histone deacetylase family protein [Arenibaculum sp.]
MRFVFSDVQLRHAPPQFLQRGRPVPCPETAERARMLLGGIERRGGRVEAPPSFGSGPRAAVHAPEYLAFLETAWERWRALPGSSDTVIPNVHRNTDTAEYPGHIVGQAGWHMADTSCPIAEGTWEAACAAADGAVHAAMLVAGGEVPAAYALCRPPGHHASADMAGGFCYLNNVAIAVQAALPALGARGRPMRAAILDVDVHHGNGTQAIFYEREDVLVVSVHADPAQFYPYFAGYAHERGRGRGRGYNLNLPLPIGTEEDRFLDAVAEACAHVARFAPELFAVSLGFDTYGGDPLAAFRVTTPGFARLGRLLAAQKLPTVLIQEGGYATAALADNLDSFLEGFGA